MIGRAGIGVDNVDIPAASRRGIIVMNTPFGNSITTAEHAIALMFALARQIPEANASTHAGKWEKNRFMGVEITGKTLGVIGCGNIGSIVATRGVGLKMHVIAYDPFLSEQRASELGVEKVELDELFARADIITLHTPLTDKTRNIIDAAAIARMKDGVRIINCARGGLVVEADLIAALKSGKVAGAGIDVFEVEPATDNPLFGMENVVCTPHLGASTTEAQENVALQIAEQMADYLVKGAVSNAINMPSITAEEAPRLKPFIKLAEVLGAFVGQVTEDPIKEVEILFDGSTAAMNTRALISADAGRADPAAGRRRQHGVGADHGQGARHHPVGGQARQVRRVRRLYQADRQDRASDARHRRHLLLRPQAALHPDQGHQPRRRGRPPHALHDQRRRARASSACSARCAATTASTSPISRSAATGRAATRSRCSISTRRSRSRSWRRCGPTSRSIRRSGCSSTSRGCEVVTLRVLQCPICCATPRQRPTQTDSYKNPDADPREHDFSA